MKGRLGLFRLAGANYAVPLERLLHVIDNIRVESLPLVPEGLAGMLVVDDEVVPVLDSCWLPGARTGCGAGADYQVLVTTELGPVALPADATVGIVAESRGERGRAEPENETFLRESFSYRGSRFLILDIDVLVMSLIRS